MKEDAGGDGRYLVCGGGRTGRYVAGRLRDAGHGVLLVEREPTQADELEALGFDVLRGDATDPDVLEHAGAATAEGLVIAVESDADTSYIAITARELQPRIRILARCLEESSERTLQRAGVDWVVSPIRAEARQLLEAALNPGVADLLELLTISEELEVELGEVTLEEGCPLAGKTLQEADVRAGGDLLVVAVLRAGGFLTIPSGETTLSPGDTLVVLAPGDHLARLRGLGSAAG
jgi:voltage-gated potassium channel